MQASQYLRLRQIYRGFASIPKGELAGIIDPTGGQFVEGAILGALGASGGCPELLLGGEHRGADRGWALVATRRVVPPPGGGPWPANVRERHVEQPHS